MTCYKATIQLKSSILTPLHGDTIWGHLCWGIFWHEGQTALEAFLDEYKNEFPLVISNAFPKGYLPIPVLQPDNYQGNPTLSDIKTYKKFKKYSYISYDLFTKKTLSPSLFLEEYHRDMSQFLTYSDVFEEKDVTRNSVDLLTGTTGENALYSVTEFIPKSGRDIFEIYIVSSKTKDWVKEKCYWTFENGYGADSSTGKGCIEVLSVAEFSCKTTGNRYMALGNFIPENSIGVEEFRGSLFTKYGKIGNPSVMEDSNPFKKPTLLYKEGSTFEKIEDMQYFGTMLNSIHKNPNIMNLAAAPLVAFMEEIAK